MTLRRGFTTIELLLATTLAAVMMIGVLRVVGSIRPHLTNNPQSQWASGPKALIELFKWDLTNAHSVWQKDNEITLVGYDALDRRDFGWRRDSGESSLHQPVEVKYRLWHDPSGQPWLLRKQTHAIEQTNRNAWSEVVGHGIAQFEILEPSGMLDVLAGPTIDAWLERPSPVPDRVRLVVRWAGDETPSIDASIILR